MENLQQIILNGFIPRNTNCRRIKAQFYFIGVYKYDKIIEQINIY